MPDLGSLDRLIACPTCDALHRATDLEHGERASCHRCHTVLIAPRSQAGMTIIAMAFGVVVLVVAALSFPFLSIGQSSLSNDATLLDAARVFSGGPFFPLSFAVFATAVFATAVLVPLARAALILYVLTPLVFDHELLPQARAGFRIAEQLRPWSMAEIFFIATAVSLVELSELATIHLGPGFLMFVLLVGLEMVQDAVTCSYSVWKDLDGDFAA